MNKMILENEFLARTQTTELYKGVHPSLMAYISWLENEVIEARKNAPSEQHESFGELLMLTALEVYDVTEIKGKLSHPLILEMFRSAGHSWVKDDATAWCSAFMCWLCNKNNLESTQKLNARSWLSLENEVNENDLKIGDILIFWRVSPDDWRGHVGLYVGQDKKHYFVLGGNQSDKVQVSKYSKNNFLGARRPKRV